MVFFGPKHNPPEPADADLRLWTQSEWPEYRDLDYSRIYRRMNKPAFVFDGRNILNHPVLFKLGFNVYPLGKKGLSHFR